MYACRFICAYVRRLMYVSMYLCSLGIGMYVAYVCMKHKIRLPFISCSKDSVFKRLSVK